MIVIVFMLQNTLGKIKMTLVLEIYKQPLWQWNMCLTWQP